jgi:hypothetical protein
VTISKPYATNANPPDIFIDWRLRALKRDSAAASRIAKNEQKSNFKEQT